MNRNENGPLMFAVSGLTPTEQRRLRESYCGIGEACPHQPRTFTDNRNPDSPHKAFMAAMPHYLKAIDAAQTHERKVIAVERACRHLDEQKAILRARVEPVELVFRDVRLVHQHKDGSEDEAQERFACEPTPQNAEAWANAILDAHEVDFKLLARLRAFFSGKGHGPQRVHA